LAGTTLAPAAAEKNTRNAAAIEHEKINVAAPLSNFRRFQPFSLMSEPGNNIAAFQLQSIRRRAMNELIPAERIENRIYLIRGQKVMLDKDLANLYEVKTKALNQAIGRNIERFPEDFMFQLTWPETERLRSQFVTLKNKASNKRGLHAKFLPYAFTEQGISMLSSVLRSRRAIEINIMIMRAFVRLRQILSTNKDLSYLFRELKGKVDRHDAEIGLIIRAIEKMIAVEIKPKKRIGFKIGKDD
jgi:hypothetical protein